MPRQADNGSGKPGGSDFGLPVSHGERLHPPSAETSDTEILYIKR